jgi:pyridoxal phosphate enzyme (YggS family)
LSVDVGARLAEVRAEIVAAARAVGRDPATVRLVAVSKGQPAEALRAAWRAGQRDFGENYAGELAAKQAALADLDGVAWHFVGRVQRGNARAIATAALVHGVGSTSQAQALDKEAARRAVALPVLLQVNLVDEATKNGFSAEGLVEALPALRALPHLRLRGLMAMPLVDDDALPAAFASVRRLRDAVCADLHELSMGMSGDFAAAIAEGATIVRVGTRIFGPRAQPPTTTTTTTTTTAAALGDDIDGGQR